MPRGFVPTPAYVPRLVLLPTACEQKQQANPPPPTAPGKLGDFPFCSFCLARIFDISQIEMCANLNCRCLLLGAIVSGIFQALEHANTQTHTQAQTQAQAHTYRESLAQTPAPTQSLDASPHLEHGKYRAYVMLALALATITVSGLCNLCAAYFLFLA